MKFGLLVKKMPYFIFSFCFLFIFVPSTTAEYIAPGVRLTPLTNDGRSVAAAWAYKGNQVAYFLLETDTQKQLMQPDSPMPEWPVVDSNDFSIVPIMEDGYLDNED